MRIRQSDLGSYAYCPQRLKLEREQEAAGERRANLSATAFGTVIHHALQALEMMHHEGRPDAVDVAVRTFEHYWSHDNIDALVPGGVDIWLPRQTHQGLMTRGRENLRSHYASMLTDKAMLMGLEVQFLGPLLIPSAEAAFEVTNRGEVKVDGPAEDHEMTGTVDRIMLRVANGKPFLSIDDFKSGVKKTYLRWAFQWTYYSFASLQPWFWQQWTEEELAPAVELLARRNLALYEDGSGRKVIPRRGRWISIRNTYGQHDCGWRHSVDYARMLIAVREYVEANRKNVFPLRIDGETCQHCAQGLTGRCGGVPIASADEGVPS